MSVQRQKHIYIQHLLVKVVANLWSSKSRSASGLVVCFSGGGEQVSKNNLSPRNLPGILSAELGMLNKQCVCFSISSAESGCWMLKKVFKFDQAAFGKLLSLVDFCKRVLRGLREEENE